MKKIISLISALSLTAACVNASAFAADGEKPEAADIGGAAYEKLMERQQTYDLNMDGTITMEELTQARTLTLDLDEVTSIEWLGELKNCAYLFLSNGSYTDLSVICGLTKLNTLSLTNIPAEDLSFLGEIGKIDTLKLNSIPIEDISFLKDMEINTCTITNMPQISVEQRFAVTRYDKDLTVEKGFSSEAGILPRGIFDTKDIKFSVADPDIVTIGTTGGYVSECRPRIFGKNVGSSAYTLSVDGTDILTGTIIVTEPELFSPPLHDTVSDAKVVSGHMSGAVNMCFAGGTLYTMLNDRVEVYADNVKAFTTSEVRQKYNVYYYYDYILKNDGTLTVNGTEQEGSYAGADFGCFWNDKGELFTVYPRDRKPTVLKIADDFGEFLDDGKNLYVNRDGEVIRYTVRFDEEGGEPTVTTEATGIKDPIDSLQMMIRVRGNDLWKFNPNNPSEMYKKICENVVKLDYCFIDESQSRSYVYFTEDGKAYEIGNYNEVTPSQVTRDEKLGYSENRVVPLYHIDDGSGAPYYPLRLIHTTEGVMTFAFKDNHMSVSDVEQYLCLRMDNGIENGFLYFTRTDGSIWQYDIAANECREMIVPGSPEEPLAGDINGDGQVLVSDLTALSRWLLGSGGSVSLKNADLNGDGTVDVFDLCRLRRLLLSQQPDEEPTD